MPDETESFEFKIDLSKVEADTLRQIRAKINQQEGEEWSFKQILAECAAISLMNWKKMQFLSSLTPRGN